MRILAAAEDLPATSALRAQLVCLWITPAVGAILLVAFVSFPGFLPPMSPQMSASDVAAFYAENTAMIRFSMLTFNLCAIMLLPFFTLIVVQMKRMATQTHALAYCYLTAVVSGATIFALADIFYLVAAFRRDRDPALVQLLNDLAWITLVAPVGMLVAQNLLLAAAIFFDTGRHGSPRPVFPRWTGYFAALTGVAMAPAAAAAVVSSGPLAWNGVVSFWVRIAAFVAFVTVMFFVLRNTLRRQVIDDGLAA
ncbi:hypothetical protein MJO55_18695 [Mycolicibacterium rufum]|uniref:DUF4386 family protein n=1 Tax=Mycolicibacterium rufum TaxID=318424 RepID=A0A9X2YA65_9MYCO|nr:hypothetical protein [Mycolicibacterium rufum]KGI69120.1 membrane protein [Mycolicibacterium rufum]MCV7070008.1 hypothetical protein [Mycolicibacterium rufum]ULP35304.1 hypothetical protein MJO55_18695 [Mycolicibacterium rufum]